MDEEIVVVDSSDDEDDDDADPDYNPTQGRPVVMKLRKVIKKIRISVQMRQKLRKRCEIYKIKYKVPIFSFVYWFESENKKVPIELVTVV